MTIARYNTLDEAIEILQGLKDGKEIEYRLLGESVWDKSQLPLPNFYEYQYRIKPEPVLRPLTKDEWWRRLGGAKTSIDRRDGILKNVKILGITPPLFRSGMPLEFLIVTINANGEIGYITPNAALEHWIDTDKKPLGKVIE